MNQSSKYHAQNARTQQHGTAAVIVAPGPFVPIPPPPHDPVAEEHITKLENEIARLNAQQGVLAFDLNLLEACLRKTTSLRKLPSVVCDLQQAVRSLLSSVKSCREQLAEDPKIVRLRESIQSVKDTEFDNVDDRAVQMLDALTDAVVALHPELR